MPPRPLLAEPAAPEAIDASAGLVLGLDNVPMELPLARIGSRVLAAVLDYLVLGLMMALWVMAVIAVVATLGIEGGWAVAAVLLGAFAAEYGWFALQEVLSGGRTLGKRVFGLRVVAGDGSAASVAALVVRNLVRLLDLLFGLLLMAADPLSRRLGDRLAGTVVVHQRRDGELLLTRLPRGWSVREVRVVEAFLRRAAALEPGRRRQLGERLEAWVESAAPGFLGAPSADPVSRLRRAFGAEER
ncbi:MAG TPA: RDD family protein [Thermoanaerobaculia bacterium]|nr:RDD family protein [Thermoanaerobaculia bacterium]